MLIVMIIVKEYLLGIFSSRKCPWNQLRTKKNQNLELLKLGIKKVNKISAVTVVKF